MQLDVKKTDSKKFIQVKSCSKINLCLWIKEKRTDNYHEINTVFLENDSLHDDIDIEFVENVNLTINVFFYQAEFSKSISKKENLAYKAALLFFQRFAISGICNIKINKRIPLQSGLGGGSSNAASVLKGLNQMFNYCLKEHELVEIAGQIGSDVPFFITGKTCFAKGRGGILQKLENNLNLEIKIYKPKNISISTSWAYNLIDSREFIPDRTEEIKALIQAMKDKNYDLFFRNIFNDFEIVIFSTFPELINERKKLLSEGFNVVGLCGSGSAIFGIRRKS